MRITVNLATRPYVQLRPFFLRLRIFMGVLAVVGVCVAIAAHSMQKKLNVAEAQMNQLQDRTVAFQQEKLRNEQRMRQPANAAILDRAHFLNELFLRKSFSWTAVMMDLETVLPGGVEVTSIEPQITGDGDVIIHLRVSGERDRAVQLVRNLERSRRFLAPKLIGELTQAKEGTPQAQMMANNGAPPGVEFEILANYNPLPENETYAKAKAAESAVGAEGAPAVRHSRPGGGPRAVPIPRSGVRPGSAYPRDGVVLRPYVPPARPNAAQPNPQGGAR